MCYHAKFGRYRSNVVGTDIGSEQFRSAVAPTLEMECGFPSENISRLDYLAKCWSRSRSIHAEFRRGGAKNAGLELNERSNLGGCRTRK